MFSAFVKTCKAFRSISACIRMRVACRSINLSAKDAACRPTVTLHTGWAQVLNQTRGVHGARLRSGFKLDQESPLSPLVGRQNLEYLANYTSHVLGGIGARKAPTSSAGHLSLRLCVYEMLLICSEILITRNDAMFKLYYIA